MAEKKEISNEKINGISRNCLIENLTIIDLSRKDLCEIDDNLKFPKNLCELNLSHNKFEYIPQTVLCLQNLKKLDISWNSIEYFDETPSFCHSIEELDISNNKLLGPPYWIWSESATKLNKINISNNVCITNSLNREYFEELLQYKTLVQNVVMYNCKFGKHIDILSTFTCLKSIILGTDDLSYLSANLIEDMPCAGLSKCCVIEKLNLRCTFLCNILPDIATYRNLKEIDLAYNKISSLPKEFGDLESLEVCLLSCNSILYLPNDFVKLKRLKTLCIDSNELCMLPENMDHLESLKTLDIYDNYLSEFPQIYFFDKVDLAQNYFDEPDDSVYLEKRSKLRVSNVDRCNGRKPEVIHDESDHTPKTSDDESLILENYENNNTQEIQERPPSSSSEDWDSEEWWQPCNYHPRTVTPPQSAWITFVQRKIEAGNFCPSDLHTIPVAERVKYEKMCKTYVKKVVEGQFDDLSDDNS